MKKFTSSSVITRSQRKKQTEEVDVRLNKKTTSFSSNASIQKPNLRSKTNPLKTERKVLKNISNGQQAFKVPEPVLKKEFSAKTFIVRTLRLISITLNANSIMMDYNQYQI